MKEINWDKLRSNLMSYSARFTNDYDMREDLVQDTILKILNKSDLCNIGCVKAYASTTLKNKWINLAKRETKSSFVRGMLEDIRFNHKEEASEILREVTQGDRVLSEIVRFRTQGSNYQDIGFALSMDPQLCRKYYSNFMKEARNSQRLSVYFNFYIKLFVEGLENFSNFGIVVGDFCENKVIFVPYGDVIYTRDNCLAFASSKDRVLFISYGIAVSYGARKCLSRYLGKWGLSRDLQLIAMCVE